MMKTTKMLFQATAAAFLVGLFSVFASAQGPVSDAATTTSNLEMSATIQSSVQLNISTGTSGATVAGSNASGLYTVSFGNVNGLGVGTPTAGVTVVTDSTGALYKTPINLTPVYSGFEAADRATVTVVADSDDADGLAREGSNTISAASTVAASHDAVLNGVSGTSVERFVGFYIPRTAEAGAKTATLIYTITIE